MATTRLTPPQELVRPAVLAAVSCGSFAAGFLLDWPDDFASVIAALSLRLGGAVIGLIGVTALARGWSHGRGGPRLQRTVWTGFVALFLVPSVLMGLPLLLGALAYLVSSMTGVGEPL